MPTVEARHHADILNGFKNNNTTLWLVLHYFVRVAGPFGEAHHPLEAWALRAHGLTAMLSLLVCG